MDNEQIDSLLYKKRDTESEIIKNLDVLIESDWESNTTKLRIKALLKHMNTIQDEIDNAKLKTNTIEEKRLKLALNLRRF
ncbi:MAG: hypothetical protein ACE5R5_02740 [Nitrosarchaeum sp.]